MNAVPEELQPWVDQLRHRIDQTTPDIPDSQWTRTEIGTMCVSLWFQGFSEALGISDTTPGLPAGIADLLYTTPEYRHKVAGMCSRIAAALLTDVGREG